MLKQLDAWLEWLWNHSPPGKAQARQRERRRLAWRRRDMQRAAEQARARIAQARAHLDPPQFAALEAWLARLDAEHAIPPATEPHLADDPAVLMPVLTAMQQQYGRLERCANAFVAIALGMQDVTMRIGQVQQAIAQLPTPDPAAGDGPQRRGPRSPDLAREKLAKLQAQLQRLQKRYQKLLPPIPTAEADYTQQLEKLAADIAALEERGFNLWRTLAPEAFATGIAAAQAFQADVAAVQSTLPSQQSPDAGTHRNAAGTVAQGDCYVGEQSSNAADPAHDPTVNP
jgi:DNA-binding transcriptional MerR regulator